MLLTFQKCNLSIETLPLCYLLHKPSATGLSYLYLCILAQLLPPVIVARCAFFRRGRIDEERSFPDGQSPKRDQIFKILKVYSAIPINPIIGQADTAYATEQSSIPGWINSKNILIGIHSFPVRRSAMGSVKLLIHVVDQWQLKFIPQSQ